MMITTYVNLICKRIKSFNRAVERKVARFHTAQFPYLTIGAF